MDLILHNAVWRSLSKRGGYLSADAVFVDRQRYDLPFYGIYGWQDTQPGIRSIVDGSALLQLYSDRDIHLAYRPHEAIDAYIFDCLEQVRVDSLGASDYAGLRSNLQHGFERWSAYCHQQGLENSQIDLLLYTVIQMVWARLNNQQAIEHTEGLIEATRAGIAKPIGHALLQLKQLRHRQRDYAQVALQICTLVSGLIESENEKRGHLKLVKSPLLQAALDNHNSQSSRSAAVCQERPGSYTVFTEQYDQQCFIEQLVRTENLQQLRHTLDATNQKSLVNRTRLSLQLRKLFCQAKIDGWSGQHRDGYIDGRYLTQMAIGSSTVHDVFFQPAVTPSVAGHLMILIDCSGSMKANALWISNWVDVLVRAAEQAQIKTIVKGFTTVDWNGGQVYQDWLAKNKPTNPGRLNARRMITFKQAQQSYRQSRNALAGLLKTTYYKESIDGESVEQACMELLKCSDKKMLVVLSDAYALDSCTQQHNTDSFLEEHLRNVLHNYADRLSVIGLGVNEQPHSAYRYQGELDTNLTLSNYHYKELVQHTV